MKVKELLERILATQVLLFNRLTRMEHSLSNLDPHYFDKVAGNSYAENVADVEMAIRGIEVALGRYASGQDAALVEEPGPVERAACWTDFEG